MVLVPVGHGEDPILQNSLPGPQRRVLLEMDYFPYGTAPAENVVPGRLLKEDAQVLLLGCGDVRKLLWTAGSASGHLQFHLNDNSIGVLARNLLLLHILENMDPDCRADLHYLWNVWYNVFWDTKTTDRFVSDVQALLQSPIFDGTTSVGGKPFHCTIEDPAFASQLRDLLSWWLADGLAHPVPRLQQTRQQHLVEKFMLGAMQFFENPNLSLEEAIQRRSAIHTMTMVKMPSFTSQSDSVCAAVEEELAAYYKTGIAAVADASEISNVNPTMLDPFTGDWHVHYDLLPHSGYPRVPHRAVQSAAKAAKSSGPRTPGLLTQACLTMLRRAASKYMQRVRIGHVRVTLWGGDALRLCTTQLSGRSFDVIETSSLGDHVGLLNVLAVTAPRLKQRPLARLFTETSLWQCAAKNVEQYVTMCLGGVPQSFYPTLLGLRLLTDPELGRPVPQDVLHMVESERTSDARSLEWCPAYLSKANDDSDDAAAPVIPRVPAGLSLSPRKGTATDLAAAVQHLAGASLVTDFGGDLFTTDRSGMAFVTGMCLAYMLAAGYRKRWCLETEVPSAADALQALFVIPDHFRLEWRALTSCVALAERSGSPALAGSHASAAPPVPLPVLLEGSMTTNSRTQSMWSSTLPYKPVLRMLVGSQSAVLAVAGSTPEAMFQEALARKLHFFDNLHCAISDDTLSLCVKFMIPGGHTIEWSSAWGLLVDVSMGRNNGQVSDPVSLAGFSAQPVEEACFAQLRDALGLSAPSPGTESLRPQRGAVSMNVANCKETSSAYNVTIGITSKEEPSAVEFMPHVAKQGMSTHRYSILLRKPVPARLEVQLLHGVMGCVGHAKLVKKKRLLHLDLPKSEEWPADVEVGGMFEKDCADDLPAWTDASELIEHMQLMFSAPPSEGKTRSVDEDGCSANRIVDDELKVRIKYLSFRTFKHQVQIFRLFRRDIIDDIDGNFKEPEFSMRAHLPVRKASDGRPLLSLTVMDHRLARRLKEAGQLHVDSSWQTYDHLLGFPNGKDPPHACNILLDGKEDAAKLTRILRKLSLRTTLTKWQRENVPLDAQSPWFAVNLVPLYVDKGTDVEPRRPLVPTLSGTAVRGGTSAPAAAGGLDWASISSKTASQCEPPGVQAYKEKMRKEIEDSGILKKDDDFTRFKAMLDELSQHVLTGDDVDAAMQELCTHIEKQMGVPTTCERLSDS